MSREVYHEVSPLHNVSNIVKYSYYANMHIIQIVTSQPSLTWTKTRIQEYTYNTKHISIQTVEDKLCLSPLFVFLVTKTTQVPILPQHYKSKPHNKTLRLSFYFGSVFFLSEEKQKRAMWLVSHGIVTVTAAETANQQCCKYRGNHTLDRSLEEVYSRDLIWSFILLLVT